MSWSLIRDKVKQRLDTIEGLSARDVAPESLPEKDTATVIPGEPVIAPWGHDGYTRVNFGVAVRCVRSKLKDSQDALDEYIWPAGTRSIVVAVEGDRQLDGAVHDVRWIGVTGYGAVENTAGVQAVVNFEARTGV